MRRLTPPTTPGQHGRTIINALLLFVMLSGSVWLIATSRISTWDLRNNLWGPAYLLLRQQNPYDLSSLFELGNAVWMPMPLGVFFLIGLLTEQQASMFWLSLNIGIVLFIILLAAGTIRPRLLPFISCIVAAFLYPPMISHLGAGQYTLLAILLMLVAAYLIEENRYWAAAFLLALALAKPQLGILVVPGLFVHIILNDGLKSSLRFCGLFLLSVTLLTLPLFAFYPAWMPGLLTAIQGNPTWVHPSLFSLFQMWFNSFGLWLWLLVFIVLSGVNLRLWQQQQPGVAVYWSLALTGLATPYVWSYDFVIQLPLFVHAVFSLQRLRSQMALWIGYLFTWGSIAWVAFYTDASNYRYWFAPWLMLTAILAAYLLEKKEFHLWN